ncbi:hypothetical protein GCM10027203_38690 [Nonomuraea fastidiosa]
MTGAGAGISVPDSGAATRAAVEAATIRFSRLRGKGRRMPATLRSGLRHRRHAGEGIGRVPLKYYADHPPR